jgi:hypothetical protein
MQRVSVVSGVPLRGKVLAISSRGQLALMTEQEVFVFDTFYDFAQRISPQINPSTTLKPRCLLTLPSFADSEGGCSRFESLVWNSPSDLVFSAFRDDEAMVDFVRSSFDLPAAAVQFKLLGLSGEVGNLIDSYPSVFSLFRSPRIPVAANGGLWGVGVGNIFLLFRDRTPLVAVECESEISSAEISEDRLILGTMQGVHVVEVQSNSRIYWKCGKFPISRVASLRSTEGLVVLAVSGCRVIGHFGSKWIQIGDREISDLHVMNGNFFLVEASGCVEVLTPDFARKEISVSRKIPISFEGQLCGSVFSLNGHFLYLAIFDRKLEIFRFNISEHFSLVPKHENLEDFYTALALNARVRGSIHNPREISDLQNISEFFLRLGVSHISAYRPQLICGLHFLYWKLFRRENSIRDSEILASENKERAKIFRLFPKPEAPETTCGLCSKSAHYAEEDRSYLCENRHRTAVSGSAGKALRWDAEIWKCDLCGNMEEEEGICQLCHGSILKQ